MFYRSCAHEFGLAPSRRQAAAHEGAPQRPDLGERHKTEASREIDRKKVHQQGAIEDIDAKCPHRHVGLARALIRLQHARGAGIGGVAQERD